MPLLEERDSAQHLMQDPGNMLGQGHLGRQDGLQKSTGLSLFASELKMLFIYLILSTWKGIDHYLIQPTIGGELIKE